jgi:hypothetical protein
MARPEKQGLSYFPHDTDALNDKKIQRLISEHELTGYGFYFALLEDIYSCLPNPYKWSENGEILCRKCRISGAKAARILNFCLETQLFFADQYEVDTTLTSQSIIERAETILKARNIKRKQRQMHPITTGQTTRQTTGQRGEREDKDKDKGITNVIHQDKGQIVETLKLPDWINKEVWDAYLEMRKKKKQVPTDYAIQLILKDLERFKVAGDDPNKVLEKSIVSGWPGVFPLKKDDNLYGNKKEGENGQHKTRDSRVLPTHYTTPEELDALENGGGQSV